MKYIKDAVLTYFTFFAFFGLLTFGIPTALAFITWDWDIVAIPFLMTILRINIVIAAVTTLIFYIELWVKKQ
jgi:hypothetical protein